MARSRCCLGLAGSEEEGKQRGGRDQVPRSRRVSCNSSSSAGSAVLEEESPPVEEEEESIPGVGADPPVGDTEPAPSMPSAPRRPCSTLTMSSTFSGSSSRDARISAQAVSLKSSQSAPDSASDAMNSIVDSSMPCGDSALVTASSMVAARVTVGMIVRRACRTRSLSCSHTEMPK